MRNVLPSAEWLFLLFTVSSLGLFFTAGGYYAYSSWDYRVNFLGRYYGGFVVMCIIGFLFAALSVAALLAFFAGNVIEVGMLRVYHVTSLLAHIALWAIALTMMCVLWGIAFCIVTMAWATLNIILGVLTFTKKSDGFSNKNTHDRFYNSQGRQNNARPEELA